MKYGNEVVGIVEMYKVFQDTYGTNHMHKYLRIEENKSEVKIKIHNQHIKMYVTKNMDMVNNIDSIHVKIWGKFTELLQNMINHIDKSTMKHNDKYVIWLPKYLKTVSTGIDSLGNTE